MKSPKPTVLHSTNTQHTSTAPQGHYTLHALASLTNQKVLSCAELERELVSLRVSQQVVVVGEGLRERERQVKKPFRQSRRYRL